MDKSARESERQELLEAFKENDDVNEVHYEDSEDRFSISSLGEDKLMKAFNYKPYKEQKSHFAHR